MSATLEKKASLKKDTGSNLRIEKTPGASLKKKPVKPQAKLGLDKSTLTLGKKDRLRALRIGLGWDPLYPPKLGLLASLMGKPKEPLGLDLDASLLVFDEHKLHIDTVWMRKMRGMDGTIRHSGDNIDGEGEGDNERILINLEKLPSEAVHLVVTVSSFNGQQFSAIKNARLRILDLVSKEVLHKVGLKGTGDHTGMVMAVISRGADGWNVRNVGQPIQGRSIIEIAEAAQAALYASRQSLSK
ncbi:MAG: TerD family protein [Roseibium sp.]|uniref:TerD family protein n=1 Tax=Roseibium sp. TaxID=1936156 RepID=UPI00329694EA